MDFNQTGTDTLLGRGKEVISFGDLDLIYMYKVTPALWMSNFDQKLVLKQMTDSGQTYCIVTLG